MAIILGDTFAYNTTQFSYSNGCFVAEASDLRYNEPRRIYDDACDVGIALRNPKTGNVVRYYLDSEDSCNEDVAGWRFKPIAEDCRRNAGIANTSVLIIND